MSVAVPRTALAHPTTVNRAEPSASCPTAFSQRSTNARPHQAARRNQRPAATNTPAYARPRATPRAAPRGRLDSLPPAVASLVTRSAGGGRWRWRGSRLREAASAARASARCRRAGGLRRGHRAPTSRARVARGTTRASPYAAVASAAACAGSESHREKRPSSTEPAERCDAEDTRDGCLRPQQKPVERTQRHESASRCCRGRGGEATFIAARRSGRRLRGRRREPDFEQSRSRRARPGRGVSEAPASLVSSSSTSSPCSRAPTAVPASSNARELAGRSVRTRTRSGRSSISARSSWKSPAAASLPCDI